MTKLEFEKVVCLLSEIVNNVDSYQYPIKLPKTELLILADYLENIGECVKANVIRTDLLNVNIYRSYQRSYYIYSHLFSVDKKITIGHSDGCLQFLYLEDLIWFAINREEIFPSKILYDRTPTKKDK